MANVYHRFLNKGIDTAPLGVECNRSEETYFCTPKGASIIGWAGVDGIHYCFIRGFGEMVFAVSPMNIAPDYVHPLAENFTDFLRLLLACGDAAALEQAGMWDKATFENFLKANPTTAEQEKTLTEIAVKMKLTPMERPWEYIKALQSSFDYSKVKYTEEFYDPDMNRAAEPDAPQWKVFFNGDFWHHKGKDRAGKEIAIGKKFEWAARQWLIPAAYLCSKGLVVDFCMRVEAEKIRDFMRKWNLNWENGSCEHFTREQHMKMELDHPLCLDLNPQLEVNGRKVRTSHSRAVCYNPCLPDETANQLEAKWVVEHYDLDAAYVWVVYRYAFPWENNRRAEIKNLSLTMEQQPVSIPGPHFKICDPGDTVAFLHSVSGKEYTLTVQEIERQTISKQSFGSDRRAYPTHYCAMRYTISPEIPDGKLTVVDCAESDQPEENAHSSFESFAVPDAATIGIIGGADGPTAIMIGAGKQGELRAACSSLHFSPVPVNGVEWRMVFHEKQFGDMTIRLI